MSKKYYSNKYSKIFCMNTMIEAMNKLQNTHDKLLIHTANGIYVGTLRDFPDYDDLEIQEGDDLLTIYKKTYLKASDAYEHSEESSEIEKVQENSISIMLENVTVLTSNRPINLPFVEIFIDQIIGVSIGSIDSTEK